MRIEGVRRPASRPRRATAHRTIDPHTSENPGGLGAAPRSIEDAKPPYVYSNPSVLRVMRVADRRLYAILGRQKFHAVGFFRRMADWGHPETEMPQVAPWGRNPRHQPHFQWSKSMATGSKKSVTPTPTPEFAKSDIDKLLQSGLADFSLRELLGVLLSSVGAAERQAYLSKSADDKANGFYPRSVVLGSLPIDVEVARTRSGQFRSAILPARYQRGYSEETQSLLIGLLTSSRSLSAARDALRKMGLSNSEQDLDNVAASFIEELELRNSRPVDPDLLALFFDGKYIEIKDGDRLKPACIYLVVGLARDGKKRVLACITKSGRENLEDWKLILRGLIERGLRRVLIVVHDDFSGLLPITKGLFPTADVQLCVVHMQRNARNHLSKTDSAEFQQRWRAVKCAWNESVGATQFQRAL